MTPYGSIEEGAIMTRMYGVPDGIPVSKLFKVSVNGTAAEVADGGYADFVTGVSDGPFVLTVDAGAVVKSARVRPASKNIVPELAGREVHIRLPGSCSVSIEIEGAEKPLYVFMNTPCDPPSGVGVLKFGGGKLHDVGVLEVASGQTVYIEGGSAVRGSIVFRGAEHAAVEGHGILEGGASGAFGHRMVQGTRSKMIVFDGCRHVRVENVTLVRPTEWMIVVGASEDVRIQGVREIGEVVSSDGVDIVGSRNVVVEDCFFTNNDDCVVVKARSAERCIPWKSPYDWCGDVRGVSVRRCVFTNVGSGNAMEIGYELCCDSVSNIVFEDIDVLAAHMYAAVFSIHNGDRACVHGVRYRNIRVEHYWNKLVDFRILTSMYTHDAQRGTIEDVAFENINCIKNVFNTPSLIGGWDAEHRVRDVSFRNFRIGGKVVKSADDLELFTRNADDISFA